MKNWQKLSWLSAAMLAFMSYLLFVGEYLQLIAFVVFVLSIDPIVNGYPRRPRTKPEPEPDPDDFSWMPFSVTSIAWCSTHRCPPYECGAVEGETCDIKTKVYRDYREKGPAT